MGQMALRSAFHASNSDVEICSAHLRFVAIKKPHVHTRTSGLENPELRTRSRPGNKLIFLSRNPAFNSRPPLQSCRHYGLPCQPECQPLLLQCQPSTLAYRGRPFLCSVRGRVVGTSASDTNSALTLRSTSRVVHVHHSTLWSWMRPKT